MNTATKKYIRKLRFNLKCTPSTKHRLIKQFQQTLLPFLEESPSPTFTQLESAFGPPEEMAKILSSEILPSDNKAYKWTRRLYLTIVIVTILLIIGFTLYVYFIQATPTIINDVIYDNGTTSYDDIITQDDIIYEGTTIINDISQSNNER